MTPAAHPLLGVLLRAVAGAPPPVDGGVEFVPPPAAGLRAVVAFTGHAYVATDQPESDFADLRLDGFGRAMGPYVLLRLAGPGSDIGVLDATLAGHGLGTGSQLPERTDLTDHPRVRHADRLRRDLHVYGDERGLVTLGRGLAGRLELSIEVDRAHQGRGLGAGLLADALALAPADEVVFAAVSPGNVRSMRLFLRAGFQPVASEVIVAGPS